MTARIEVSKDESESHWQRNDYKSFNPSTDWDKVDFSKAPAIQEMPVTSVVCDPQNGEEVKLKNGNLELRGINNIDRFDFRKIDNKMFLGYAWSGGGRGIVRVDISLDQGKTWHVAELVDPTSVSRQWAWTRWQINLPVTGEEVPVWVRAVDSSYNTQPEGMEHIWNLRGLMAVGYHKINVKVKAD